MDGWRGLPRRVRRRFGKLRRGLVVKPGKPSGGAVSPEPSRAASPRPLAAAGGTESLVRYLAWLPERTIRLVVVLADTETDLPWPAIRDADRLVVIATEERPEWESRGHPVEFRAAATLDEINWLFRFLGPADVIVDAALATAHVHGERWQRLFLYLGPGGLYLLPRSAILDRALPAPVVAAASWVGVAASSQKDRAQQERELALGIRMLSIGSDLVVLQKRNRHVLKVREWGADRILPAREPRLRLRVLDSLPAGRLTGRAGVSSYGTEPDSLDLPTAMDYPELKLRLYEGRIAMVSNALLHTQDTALPDSFRHHRTVGMVNPQLVDATPDLARVPARVRPARTLKGSYYHVDLENSGHFGHLMTEGISRLWGWDAAKEAVPDLKAVFRIRYANERRPELERQVLGAYGIPAEDVTWIDEPVWLERVVAATPMWHNAIPHYVHPGLTETWSRIKSGLLGPDSTSDGLGSPARLFVSRRDTQGNRACMNARDVERFFVDRGFTVIYPEDHGLATQARLFATARVIAGFGGSAMFNILYASAPAVMVLAHRAYTARNELLFSALLGGSLDYFWSAPELDHPHGQWSEKAYYSPWSFDFGANASSIDDVLSRCPGAD